MHEIGVVRSMVKTVTDFAEQNDIKDFLIREIHIPEDRKHLGSMFTMEPLSVQKVRDFFIRFKNATFFVKINFHKKSRCARQEA